MAIGSLYIGNDNILELNGLLNVSVSPSTYVNTASVAVTLYDTNGDEVSGETWPLTMSYVASSNGVYRATLSDSLSLKVNRRYRAKITANGGAGLQGEWHENVQAVRR
jgi:hypothetical protein